MYRHTDPPTSKQAADELRATGKLGERQQQVLAVVRSHPGRTHGEIAGLMLKYYPDLGILCCAESPHKRLPELEQRGFVVAIGERRCTDSGKNARLWYPAKTTEKRTVQLALI